MTALERLILDYRDLHTGAFSEQLIAAAREEQRQLIEALRQLEWSSRSPLAEDCSIFATCPSCDRYDFHGHEPGCELAALLAKHKEPTT